MSQIQESPWSANCSQPSMPTQHDGGNDRQHDQEVLENGKREHAPNGPDHVSAPRLWPRASGGAARSAILPVGLRLRPSTLLRTMPMMRSRPSCSTAR
jgi:hypothetical protein